MAGTFVGGTGDYVALFEPTASALELDGSGHILASVGEVSGEIPYTAYFANKSFIAENPDLIERFTKAVYRGLQYVKNTPSAEIAEVIAPQFPDSDIDLLTTVIDRYKSIDAWSSDPVMTEDSFNRLQDVMQAAGELDQRAPYDVLIDNSFAAKVSR
jgi:NitT/TauT family transport system substrate-binding protein